MTMGCGSFPQLSVCIPAYNDAKAFSRALDSVLKQRFSDFECLVGDDSTTDAIADVVAQRGDARVRLRRHTPPLGVPANWNAVLAMARGHVVTLLHQDDFYCVDHVFGSVLEAMARERARIAVCGRSVWRGGVKLATHVRHERHVKAFLRHYPQRSLVVNRIGHPSVVFMDASLKHLQFDERLRYFLDTDWYASLWRAAGQQVVYVPSAEVGMEYGRDGQLSGRCTKDMAAVFAELTLALDKSRAQQPQRILAAARLTASHIRHWHGGGKKATVRLWQGLSVSEKTLFSVALGICLGHMGYRFLRKHLGLGSWG